MNVRTGVVSGSAMESKPYINKWMTCWKCKGEKDQYGNVSNGSCQACWPLENDAPLFTMQ